VDFFQVFVYRVSIKWRWNLSCCMPIYIVYILSKYSINKRLFTILHFCLLWVKKYFCGSPRFRKFYPYNFFSKFRKNSKSHFKI
jgi:hypothetical protein